jgi:HEAT repeat protein
MTKQHFARAVESMRSPDPGARARGFDFLREHADSYVGDLIIEFEREPDDQMRCLLLELISEARSPEALPVLTGQLESDDESLRFWAVRGLEMIDTRDAHDALRRARSAGWIA